MPLQTFDDQGRTIFDSEAVTGGVCLGSFRVPAGESFSRSYPTLAGCEIRVMSYASARTPDVSISYPGGIPAVTAAPVGFLRDLVIWGYGAPTVMTNAPGVTVANSSGGVAICPKARGMVYIGMAAYSATSPSYLAPSKWRQTAYLGYTTHRINSATRPLGVLKLTSNTYTHLMGGADEVSPGVWEFKVQSVAYLPSYADTEWPALLAPEIYCFAAQAATVAGPQMAVYDTETLELAYDLRAGKILTSVGVMAFPRAVGGGSTNVNKPPAAPASGFGMLGDPFRRRMIGSEAIVAGYQRCLDYVSVYRDAGGYIERAMLLHNAYQDNGTAYTVEHGQDATVEVINLNSY